MIVSTTNKWSKGFWVDLGERVAATLVGAVIGLLTLSGTTTVEWTNPAYLWTVVGLPVAFSFLKGLAANLKDGESGASLVDAPPGPVVVENGATNLLYAAGVALLLLALLLLVLKIAALVAVSWLIVAVVAVVGVFLLFWGGRGTHPL